MRKIYLLWALLVVQNYFCNAQPAFAPNGYWSAKWVQAPNVSQTAYGVYHFRKSLVLNEKPARFVVHVSADNRYCLYVNGREVGIGPARSDTQHWMYDTYDLAPYLQAGTNVLAAQVWNMGEQKPVAQMSFQTGFLLQGDGPAEQEANTNKSWKVLQNIAYQPLSNDNSKLWTYIVVGPGDRLDGRQYPWGWQQAGYNDQAWAAAREFGYPVKSRGFGTDGNWALVPRSIPALWGYPERLGALRRTEGDAVAVPADFLAGKSPLRIPAWQHVTLLFDQKFLTNAYPQLLVSGGRGATLRLSYAEGLMDDKRQKHHRDSVAGLKLIGFEDEFTLDGGANRRYSTLWFRTWRYLQVDVTTTEEALTINDLYGIFTGYPLKENAQFRSSDSTLTDLWDVGWRTARLCAMENYFDCPYYEQLQYTGDTRIQALISLYVSGDDRLVRKAIQDFADSRISDGLTQSRYPCNDPQVIPTFSMFWVSMVHDYWRHRADDAFVQQQFGVIESVLAWQEARLGPNGLNGPLEWWNFVDWCWPWDEKDRIGGVPPGARRDGGSSILSLQLVYTLKQAAELFEHYGQAEKAARYRALAAKVGNAVWQNCWDESRGLLADTPSKNSFSQHASIWGVLTDVVPKEQQVAVLQRVMKDASLTQATFYFRFYLFEALQKTGLGNEFLPQLAGWHGMLARGLTTFAEQPDPTRSDCHAWSASPNYEFLSLVCGVRPASPGFKTVRIEPFLGNLTFVEGRIPHPAGDIRVGLSPQKNGQLTGQITLPPGVTGTLVWGGGERPLVSGENKF